METKINSDLIELKKPYVTSSSSEICSRCAFFSSCPLVHPFEPFIRVYYSYVSNEFLVKIDCYVDRCGE